MVLCLRHKGQHGRLGSPQLCSHSLQTVHSCAAFWQASSTCDDMLRVMGILWTISSIHVEHGQRALDMLHPSKSASSSSTC